MNGYELDKQDHPFRFPVYGFLGNRLPGLGLLAIWQFGRLALQIRR
jgi:hypothetical protein